MSRIAESVELEVPDISFMIWKLYEDIVTFPLCHARYHLVLLASPSTLFCSYALKNFLSNLSDLGRQGSSRQLHLFTINIKRPVDEYLAIHWSSASQHKTLSQTSTLMFLHTLLNSGQANQQGTIAFT